MKKNPGGMRNVREYILLILSVSEIVVSSQHVNLSIFIASRYCSYIFF